MSNRLTNVINKTSRTHKRPIKHHTVRGSIHNTHAIKTPNYLFFS